MRRLFKNPVIAALIVLAVIAIAAPVAYAIDRVFLSIDADKTAPEIEQDVNKQLHDQGVPATATAHKSDEGIVHVEIKTDEKDLDKKLQFDTGSADAKTYRIEVDCPNETHCAHLRDAATHQDILNLLVKEGDVSDDALAAKIRSYLPDDDVEVTVKAGVITIRCR